MDYWILLGASHPNGEKYIEAAFLELSTNPFLNWVERTDVIHSPGVGTPLPWRFANAIVVLKTALSPDALLFLLRSMECRYGRVRQVQNGPRTLDLDILKWSQGIYRSDDVTLPHKQIVERPFVRLLLNQLKKQQ